MHYVCIVHRVSSIAHRVFTVAFNQLTNPLEKRASFARNVARFVVVAAAISQQIGANYKIYVRYIHMDRHTMLRKCVQVGGEGENGIYTGHTFACDNTNIWLTVFIVLSRHEKPQRLHCTFSPFLFFGLYFILFHFILWFNRIK